MTTKSGQSVLDRVTAAKHTIAGQGLAKTVCKATTEEVMGPKRKHLDYLLQCTNEPNVSIPQLADLLIERTQQGSWVIVFKALVTIHNLMNYGNERFTQYLASNNCSFNLANFIDKTGVQGYDMSTFIRRYAKYLNEKAYTYRLMAFDFCKVKRGRDDGLLRTMNSEKLLKTLPVLQKQIDTLLEFDCTANELTNGVINASFMLLFKDLIRLFACYNDGTINLLEKFFDMNKKQCKEALDIYKKFLVRMDKVSEFLKVAENVGIDKGDIPDLAKAPASLLDALEEHLKSLEGKKGATGAVAPPPKPSGYNSAISQIAGNSSIQVSEEEKRKILEEESKTLQQLKEQKAKETGVSSSQPPVSSSGNPFANPTSAPATQNASPSKPSDDLLNLDANPFVDNVKNVMQMTSAVNAFGAPGWGTPQPMSAGFDAFGEVLQPQNQIPQTTASPQQQSIGKQDLDSSLALLAGNISINGGQNVKKQQHQWQPKGDQKKTGGSNWTPTPRSQATAWSQPNYPATTMQGMMGYGQPGMMMQPGMNMPMMGGYAAPMTSMPMTTMPQMSMGMGQPMGMRPGMSPMGMGQPRPPQQPQQPNDPFGAL